MRTQWRKDRESSLPCLFAIIEEMEKKSKQFRLPILTMASEAIRDLLSILMIYAKPDISVQPFTTQSHNNQEEEKQLLSSGSDPNSLSDENKPLILPSLTVEEEEGDGETKLFEISHFDNDEIVKQHEQLRPASQRDARNKYDVSDPTIAGASSTMETDDHEVLTKIIKHYQRTSAAPRRTKLSSSHTSSIEEGLVLLRSAIWESALED